VAGLATRTERNGGCRFCVEEGLPWRTRAPRAVTREPAALRGAGCGELHLCDSEFGQDLDASKILLMEMEAEGLDSCWSLYMKPLPHDETLFRPPACNGAYAITLSVDSDSLRRGAYTLEDVGRSVALAGSFGLRIAVDLLVGFPGETVGGLRGLFDFLRRVRPDTVGVSAWIRVFKHTALGRSLRGASPPDGKTEGDDPDFIRPVYFSRLTLDDCRELMADDPLFRVEGLERRSNYDRLAMDPEQAW